jgi:hypothetical protein
MKPIQLAAQLLDATYVKNWFSAGSFFNTVYTSNVIQGKYFITHDKFMTSDIWALREISSDGIETLLQGDSKQECLDFIEGL